MRNEGKGNLVAVDGVNKKDFFMQGTPLNIIRSRQAMRICCVNCWNTVGWNISWINGNLIVYSVTDVAQ